MRMLQFIVDGQNLKKDPACNFLNLIRGSKGYLKCKFQLSDEWKKLRIIATFWRYDKEMAAIWVTDGACGIPDEVAELKNFKIVLTGVKGNKLIKTNAVKISQEDE